MGGSPFVVVDVFARAPLEGNALAVFHEPGSVAPERMQQIARETNLSETTFVTGIDERGYDVRIFTPFVEMPFAGHPTLGTAFALQHLGLVAGPSCEQRSAAGTTVVSAEDGRMWLTRMGTVGAEYDADEIVRALGGAPDDIGFDASAFGGPATPLRPALADSGVAQLMVPIRTPEILATLNPGGSFGEIDGAYCFAPLGPGRAVARFFAPGFGIAEDPATGSAAAGLGLYLGDRVGSIDIDVDQGAQVGRPSLLAIRATPGEVRVGGQVHLVAEGTLRL